MDIRATKSRNDCEETLATARRLWRESESLLYAAAEDDEDSDMIVLVAECKVLLTACNDLITSAEEILRLYDLGTDTSVISDE